MPIVLRNIKKSALTYSELDGNFTYLNSFAPLNYSGSYTGSFTGSYTGSFSGSASGSFNGSHTGSYTGSFTGSYTGSFTGSYTGSFTGSYTGSFSGSLNGNVTSPLSGSLTGSLSGSATSSSLGFGINVFSNTDNNRVYCALPSSQPGRSIDIINNGNNVLYVDGQGLTINGASNTLFPILPNGQTHRLSNIQNNTWAGISPSVPLTFASTFEFIINHTSGSETNMWSACVGNKGLISSSNVGAATTSPPSNRIILTPSASYWHTFRVSRAWATRISVESNVRPTDLGVSDFVAGYIQTAYLPATNSLSLNQVGTVFLANPDLWGGNGNNIATASIGTPYGGAIGDDGTIYGYSDTFFSTGNATQTGIGSPVSGSVSQHFFTFGVTIPASAITKTYRFLFTLDGVR